jgi:ureidoacrylate peracid hydrolase
MSAQDSSAGLLPEHLASSALLLVDMQNGFCHQEGSVATRFDVSGYRAAIPGVRRLIEAARRAGVDVVWSRQEHREDDDGRLGHRIPNHTTKLGYVPCLAGTWDAEILDELQPLVKDTDLLVVKHRSSCFYETPLHDHLRKRSIDTLIIAGVATNYCVEATIRDAYARDYDLVVVRDACGTAWPDLHEATLRNVEIFHGAVVSSADVAELLAARAASREAR